MSTRAVLLTQAENRSRAHARSLDALGVASLIWPLMRIVPLAQTAPNLDRVDALLATSAHAVEIFSRLSPVRDLPILCVGDTTAAAARDAGFASVTSVAGTARELADAAREASHRTYLYIRAREVSVDLSALIGKDRVREAVVYAAEHADPPPADVVDTFEAGRFAVVTAWSRRNAEVLADHLAASPAWNVTATTLVAISAKTADPLANSGFEAVRLAEAPDADGMIKAIADVALQRILSKPDCAGAAGPIT